MAVREGDVVWVIAGTERHPAVVLRVRGTQLLVLTGTGTAGRDFPVVAVPQGSRLLARMGLHKTTYFYQPSVVEVADTEAQSRGAHTCPQHLFVQMLTMVTRRLADFDARNPDSSR